jgi:hypothetical protein
MSSSYVRTQIKLYLQDNAQNENLIDLSGQFVELQKMLSNNNLTHKDTFLGLQWLPSGELPISLPSKNSAGCFRETGVFLMHIAEPTKTADLADAIVARADSLLSIFRSATINNDIIIESVTPANFDTTATLKFENGYQAAAVTVNFYRDFNQII